MPNNPNARPQQDLAQLLLGLTRNDNNSDDVTQAIVVDYLDADQSTGSTDTITTADSAASTAHTGAYHYGDSAAQYGFAQYS